MKKLYNTKKECCGCEACVNACPTSIITMEQDAEGFFYPTILKSEKCISCKLCETVCPVKNVEIVENFSETAYAGYAKREEELLTSSSGGLATAIAKAFIKREDGLVCGVRYNDGYTESVYSLVETEDELEKFKSSKYSQSRKNDIYRLVREQLKAGKKILFIGLPCDAYAMLRFCKNHKNLFVCTLVCHGVTSPKVLTEYIDSIKEKNETVTFLSLRDKNEGWKPYYIRVILDGNKEKLEQFNTSLFGNAFLYLKRPSCNNCKIKRNAIHSDITLGDFHNIVSTDSFYNKNGVSSLIVHTEKGQELLQYLEAVYMERVETDKAIKNRGYYEAIPAKKNRAEYGLVFSTNGLQAASELTSCKRIEMYEKIRGEIIRWLIKIRSILRRMKR